jgi:dihydrofolate reductase
MDGVMEAPGNWHKQFHNSEAQAFKHQELFDAEALLLGRRTCEIFADAWPQSSDESGFAQRMNSMPKYVVSSTLANDVWTNTTVLSSNPFEQIAELKSEPGGDLLICGSRSLAHGLFQRGMVDELRFLMDPIILGTGERLLPVPDAHIDLNLMELQQIETGSILCRYSVEQSAGLGAA